MRVAVSSEQRKFFLSHGYIEFEHLLTEEDAQKLLKQIDHVRDESPGHPETQLFRSIPLVMNLMRKRELGKIAYSLVEKKPLRIDSDYFFSSFPSFKLDENQILGLLLFLQKGGSGKGVYFKNELPPLYKDQNSCYLLLVFTTNPLSNDLNPLVFP